MSARRRLAPAAVLLLAAPLLAGCAHYPINAPAPVGGVDGGYRFDELALGPGNSDEVFVALSLSGGGTRAAALSYGVLEELRRTGVGGRTLLDEVDVISAVSGSSFPAAYYGLFRARLFEDFRERFLDRDIEGELYGLLWPWGWLPLAASSGWDRVDAAARLYDETVFGGATYADLVARRTRPFVAVQAANMSTGARFAFEQEQFDLLRSDLGPFPVGRACAASSAYPVLLSPVRLHNHPGGRSLPPDLAVALDRPEADRRLALRAQELAHYLDAPDHPYVHLIDGGVADNLGLSYLDESYRRGPIAARLDRIEHLVVIVVNARTRPPEDVDRRQQAPDAYDVLMKTVTVAINQLSYALAERLEFELRRREATEEGFPTVHVVEVTFDDLADPAERARFQTLPTSFTLPKEDVDAVVEVAGRLLREDPAFQELVAAVGGE